MSSPKSFTSNLGFCNSWITIPPSPRRSGPQTRINYKQPAIVEHQGKTMASKEISNNSGYFGLIALFFVPGFLIGIIAIILGLTQTIDPFVLTSYRYGLVIEGAVILALEIISVLTWGVYLSNNIHVPIKFVITEGHIQAILPGSMFSKSPRFIESHPLEGITGIELEEVVSRNDEGGDSVTYSAKLIGFYGTNIGTLRGISSTGVADEVANAIGVGIVRKFE